MTGDSSPERAMPSEQGDEGDYVKLEGSSQPQQQQQDLPRSWEGTSDAHNTPWLLWPIFVFALIFAATSGPLTVGGWAQATVLMQRVGPISLAGWRSQVSALVMLPGFIYESIRMGKLKREKALSSPSFGLHLLSSVALACHFGCYTWALYHTSIPHCLFIVNTPPVFVALFVKITGGDLLPSEIGGVLLGLLGMAIFTSGNNFESNTSSSPIGDLASVGSALSTAIYMLVGKTLRGWMPLFVYQFPVALCCLIILSGAGLIFEGWNESDTGLISGPFGWLRKEYWWEVVYLGVAPGVLGHMGYSYVLKYSSPLVMPCGLPFAAIIGSFLSWLIGQTSTPGAWTWVAGLLTISGSTIVGITSALRQSKLAANDENHPLHAPGANEDPDQKPLLKSSNVDNTDSNQSA